MENWKEGFFMKVVKTLKYKITSHTRTFDATVDIYNQALSFLIDVIHKECKSLEDLSLKAMVPLVEKLTHATKKNPCPTYGEFDVLFYKFPSYFRRSAIADAYGVVKSYRSNYANWENEKKIAQSEGRTFKKRPPKLQFNHKAFPVFYKGNMFKRTGETSALIKIFYKNDWVWTEITFKSQDLYKRDVWSWKENNPTLVKVGKKYFLGMSYEGKVTYPKLKLNDKVAVSVDLGITNSAVCSAMVVNGTVVGRTFINQPTEKDRLTTMVNKLKKAQRVSGYVAAPNYWRRINGLQKQIVTHTAHQIIAFAKENKANVIVFEFLDQMKIPKGFYGARRLRFKLHYWAKKAIQNKVEQMAQYLGIRISKINPRNTSALAYDGSGEVRRNDKKDLCTFSTGKQYHSDLNASYNIAARYFLREYQKSISENSWLSFQAKVPELAKRTQQTLASLISLQKAMLSHAA
jgi:putative transposase